MISFAIDCSLHFIVSSLTSGKHSFLFELNRSVEFACLHGSLVHSGFRDIRFSGTVYSEDFTK